MEGEMENRDWLNDYVTLKQVNPANPFTVPAGYFDSLDDRIVSLRNLSELTKDGSTDGFSVPENYFEELSLTIQSRLYIQNTTEGIEDTGFTVPEGYFDTLEQQIKSRISIEEAAGEPAEHFSVPPGYFFKLNNDILNATVNLAGINQKGTVRRLFASTAFKYATAACFAVAIGGGILLTELGNPADEHQNSFLHKQLSAVPADEIKSYLQLSVDPGETQHTIATEGTPVDDDKLVNALQNYVDSIQ